MSGPQAKCALLCDNGILDVLEGFSANVAGERELVIFFALAGNQELVVLGFFELPLFEVAVDFPSVLVVRAVVQELAGVCKNLVFIPTKKLTLRRYTNGFLHTAEGTEAGFLVVLAYIRRVVPSNASPHELGGTDGSFSVESTGCVALRCVLFNLRPVNGHSAVDLNGSN